MCAFSVDVFRSEMRGDGARPALFDVLLTAPSWVGFPTSQFPFKCSAAELPASKLGHKAISYFGHDVNFAGDRTYDDWTVQIYNDEDFAIRDAFEIWQNGMDRNTQATSMREGADSSPSSYVGQAIVRQYGKVGGIIKEYKFSNLWPSQVDAIRVNWDEKDTVESFGVVFKLDYYIPISGSGNATAD